MWYKYDVNNGLIETNNKEIINLLENGWNSRSLSLEDALYDGMSR